MSDPSPQSVFPAAPAPPPPPEAPPTPADAALARYTQSMRRSRTVYYAVLAVLVLGIGVFVSVVWSRSEVAHASLHTFPSPPRTLGLETPSRTVAQAWQSADRAAIGVPQWRGTIVTYSSHSVGGRDARTGARTWEYKRTDRTVCTAAQLAGTTIAIYANDGNCDEVSAFYSGTGRRRWTRTLDIDGLPLNGRPAYQATASNLVVASPTVIYSIDPVSGLNRWTYSRYGCAIEHVALGNAGALISQNCSARVKCKGVKLCGRGIQLLMRDGTAGRDDDKPNADQIKWNNLGDDSVPVSADQVTTAAAADGHALYLLDPAHGTRNRTVPVASDSSAASTATAIATNGPEVVWLGGTTYVVRADTAEPVWTAKTVAPPTIVSTVGEDAPSLSTARITVPTATGIALLDGNDGRVISTFPVGAPAADSRVYSLGSGFLVTGADGIVAYR